MNATALVSIPVGVVVERHKAASPWLDFVWRPASILTGVPSAEPWTPLGPVGDTTSFYAGTATIELHRTETANYLGNLGSGAPCLVGGVAPDRCSTALRIGRRHGGSGGGGGLHRGRQRSRRDRADACRDLARPSRYSLPSITWSGRSSSVSVTVPSRTAARRPRRPGGRSHERAARNSRPAGPG